MSTSATGSKTWFDTLDLRFDEVPQSPGIATTEFLRASDSLVTLFDLLGSTAFGPVKSDLNGNITKLRNRQNEAPGVSGTLQELVPAEWNEKKKGATATEGLIWLLRGLDFTAQALRHNINNPQEELATSFQEAYSGTLKKYHNFVIKGIFSVALKATPYRNDFYVKLGAPDEAGKKKVDDQLKVWLESLEAIVGTMQKFYDVEHPDIKF